MISSSMSLFHCCIDRPTSLCPTTNNGSKSIELYAGWFPLRSIAKSRAPSSSFHNNKPIPSIAYYGASYAELCLLFVAGCGQCLDTIECAFEYYRRHNVRKGLGSCLSRGSSLSLNTTC